MKKSPHSTVSESQVMSFFRLLLWAPLSAITTKNELNSRIAVPKVTSGISKICSQVCIFPCSMHCDSVWGSGPTRLFPLYTR